MLPSKPNLKALDIQELYVVTPIDNIASIMTLGLYSHNKAAAITHKNISNSDIQNMRATKTISITHEIHAPDPMPLNTLWEYVCLFIQPYNAMLYVSRKQDICILRIKSELLDEPGVLITDRNASCSDAKFYRPNAWSLCANNASALYERQSYPPTSTYDRKSMRQAEVLCPDKVDTDFIVGVFTKDQQDATRLQGMISEACRVNISVNPNIFFLDNVDFLKDFTPLNKIESLDTELGEEEYIGLASLSIH